MYYNPANFDVATWYNDIYLVASRNFSHYAISPHNPLEFLDLPDLRPTTLFSLLDFQNIYMPPESRLVYFRNFIREYHSILWSYVSLQNHFSEPSKTMILSHLGPDPSRHYQLARRMWSFWNTFDPYFFTEKLKEKFLPDYISNMLRAISENPNSFYTYALHFDPIVTRMYANVKPKKFTRLPGQDAA